MLLLLADTLVRGTIGARQKRSQSPRPAGVWSANPKAQRVEVGRGRCAEQAIQVRDSKKLVCNIGGLLVPNVLDWAAGHHTTYQPVEFALCVTVSALRRDHLSRHLVIRLVADKEGRM